MASRSFGIVDYVLFAISLTIAVGIGIYHAIKGRHKTTTDDFLMGDRKMKVIPLTISLAVSVISAVTLLGLPAEMYTQGTQYFFNVGSGLGILLTAFIFVPLLHPLKLTSMFEYLERRFNSRMVRLTGSILEVCALVLYGGAALYAPVIALAGVIHLAVWKFALLLGVLVTFYTALGGMKAVIWSDVVQLIVMIVGILAIMIQGCISVGGISEIFEINRQQGRLQFYDFDPNPSTRHTFWGLTVGFGMGSLSFYGASQFTFQRYAAVKTLRQAKMTVLLNLPIFYAFHVMLCFIGLIIFAYYAKNGCDPLESKEIISSNQLLPTFVMDTLGHIPGLAGLFVAALTSGALSTLSSVMNSIAALVWDDFLKRFFPQISDQAATIVNKITVVITGVLVVCLSFVAHSLGPHIFQVCFALLGATGGPQLGMFLLGALVPWANWKGAISGCVAGSLFSAWITIGTFVTKPFSPPLPPGPVDMCFNGTVSENIYTNGAMLNVTSSVLTERRLAGYVDVTRDIYTTTAGLPDPGNHEEISGITKLYTLSYVWYTAVGVLVCMTVGCIVSLITRKSSEKPESHLVLHWWKVFKILRNKLKRCCGINPDTELAISNMYTIEYRGEEKEEAEINLMNGEAKEPNCV